MKTNINKDETLNEWKRVFKILPIKTEDGFRVMLGYVWKMETDDPFEPVRYHTNPEGKEITYQAEKMARLVGVNPPPLLESARLASLDKLRNMAGLPSFPDAKPSITPKVVPDEITRQAMEKLDELRNKKVCPKCGTTNCIPKAHWEVSGTGVLHVNPTELARTCRFRQQMNAIGRLKEKGYFKNTSGTGPK